MRLAGAFSGLVMVVGLALASCRSTEPRYEPGGDGKSVAGQPNQHWIYDDQLRTSMREIEQMRAQAGNVSFGEVPEAAVGEPTGDFKQVADAAANLAAAASALHGTLDRVRLSAQDKDAFREQAQILEAQAISLVRAARRQRIPDMRKTLDAITASCISCHTRFRDITGEIAPPRA